MAWSQWKPTQHLFWQSVLCAVNKQLQPNNNRHAAALMGPWYGGNQGQHHRCQAQSLSVTSASTAAQHHLEPGSRGSFHYRQEEKEIIMTGVTSKHRSISQPSLHATQAESHNKFISIMKDFTVVQTSRLHSLCLRFSTGVSSCVFLLLM